LCYLRNGVGGNLAHVLVRSLFVAGGDLGSLTNVASPRIISGQSEGGRDVGVGLVDDGGASISDLAVDASRADVSGGVTGSFGCHGVSLNVLEDTTASGGLGGDILGESGDGESGERLEHLK